MTQIIKTSTPGKEREQLSKAIVITIRTFMRQGEPDHKTKDMVAFVILALKQISDGIDQSVAAWEKRGYWVKADKYRLEWQWAGDMSQKLQRAFSDEDWGKIAESLLETMTHFSNIKVSDRHRMGQPWMNAYKNYKNLLNK
ncbi:MAG: hypothetical protein K0B06_00935 [Brevefilum sp.]|nr:hypothetical protein [Brevefilum sp.]